MNQKTLKVKANIKDYIEKADGEIPASEQKVSVSSDTNKCKTNNLRVKTEADKAVNKTLKAVVNQTEKAGTGSGFFFS